MKGKYGAAALDPNNPAHHHAMGLPGAYYMDEKPNPPLELSPASAARLQAAREDFQRRKAAGTLPPFKR
jgi:N-formylglutamate amidohydrolase